MARTKTPKFPSMPVLVVHSNFTDTRAEWTGTAAAGAIARIAHLIESTTRVGLGKQSGAHHPRHRQALALFLAALGQRRGEAIESIISELVTEFEFAPDTLAAAKSLVDLFINLESDSERFENVATYACDLDETSQQLRQLNQAETCLQAVRDARLHAPPRYVYEFDLSLGYKKNPKRVPDEDSFRRVCRESARQIVNIVIFSPNNQRLLETYSPTPNIELESILARISDFNAKTADSDCQTTRLEALKELATNKLAEDLANLKKNATSFYLVARCQVHLGIIEDCDASIARASGALRKALMRKTPPRKRRERRNMDG